MAISKATTPLGSFAYELGRASNRTAATELNGRHVDYTYDGLYRLKSETIGLDPVTANNGSINYVYDAVGNRLRAVGSRFLLIRSTLSPDEDYSVDDIRRALREIDIQELPSKRSG